MGINFAPSGESAYQGPRTGDGVVYFGYDGAGAFLVKSIEIQEKTTTRGPVGQYVIDMEATGFDGLTDVNGSPVNGQVLRYWAEFSGQSSNGTPHGWKVKDALVSAGLYTVEQIQQIEAAAAQGNGEWANANEHTIAEQLKGRTVYMTFESTTTNRGSPATQLDRFTTAEGVEKMKQVKMDGGTRAWRPAVIKTREQRLAGANAAAGGAQPPGATQLPGMGGVPNGAGAGATSMMT